MHCNVQYNGGGQIHNIVITDKTLTNLQTVHTTMGGGGAGDTAGSWALAVYQKTTTLKQWGGGGGSKVEAWAPTPPPPVSYDPGLPIKSINEY